MFNQEELKRLLKWFEVFEWRCPESSEKNDNELIAKILKTIDELERRDEQDSGEGFDITRSIDAKAWAKACLKAARAVLPRVVGEEFLTDWFVKAILAGYDRGYDDGKVAGQAQAQREFKLEGGRDRAEVKRIIEEELSRALGGVHAEVERQMNRITERGFSRDDETMGGF